MKITKKQLFISIFSIFILLISLAIMICDFAVPLRIWTHPILTFVFCLSIGFFLLCFALGIVNKSVWFIFLSAILSTFAVIYPFAHYSFWWIGLIVCPVVWSILGLISFMLNGNKTESIALNDRPDYKNYKERLVKKNSEQVKSEELPEIKSFK